VKAVFALAAMATVFAAVPASAQTNPNAAQPAAVGETREALAERYLSITNRYALVQRTYENQLKRAMSGCDGKPCEADLHRAIEETLADIGPKFRQRMIRIYADHLSEDQLRAAIRFAETPEGRSISQAESRMTDAVAVVGNDLWKDAYVGISTRFCAVQQQICVRSSPTAAPASPQ